MSKNKRGSCIFCGARTELTIEDVLPQWAARELKRLHPHLYVAEVTMQTDGNTVLRRRSTKKGSVAGLKLPLVCGPCNKLMGREIEEPTSTILKPTLGGISIPITPDQCVTLGAWGTLKALCHDLIEPDPGRVVFAGELHAFYTRRVPPPQFKMWIGKYEGHDSDLAFHVRSSTASPESYDGFPAGTPHAQILTRILGDLIVQTVFVGIRGRNFPSQYERPENDLFAVGIWPKPTETVQWPPPMPITPEGLRHFANFPEPPMGEPPPRVPDGPPSAP